jgi:Tol biopolymer transport system component
MDGSGDAFPVVQTPFAESLPRFSPDGRWIAYQSDESGRSEIYVRQFPGPGGRWQVSTSGGSEPWWSADGQEIFYLDGGEGIENMASVAVRAADVFTAALPEVLFRARLCQSGQRNRYVVASDGQRFLMVSPVESQTIPPMTVVLNWDAALAR